MNKSKINDFINEIHSYKLKQRIDQLKKEQKELEKEKMYSLKQQRKREKHKGR